MAYDLDILMEIEKAKNNSRDKIQFYNKAISICVQRLSLFRRNIQKNGFKSEQEEIFFFKKTKQIALDQLVYYSELKSFELQFPKGTLVRRRRTIVRSRCSG